MRHETLPLSEQSEVSLEIARLRQRGKIFLISVSLVFLCLALSFAVLPNFWFTGDVFGALDHWGRSVWPKLAGDAALLDAKNTLRGTKYVIFMLCCLFTGIAVAATMLPFNWRLITMPNNWITYPVAKGLWNFPLAILILGLLLFFEQGLFIGGNASRARGITNSFFLWFWMALLWWSLSMVVGFSTILAAQLWKHGQPENKWEYLLRKERAKSDKTTL